MIMLMVFSVYLALKRNKQIKGWDGYGGMGHYNHWIYKGEGVNSKEGPLLLGGGKVKGRDYFHWKRRWVLPAFKFGGLDLIGRLRRVEFKKV